MLILGRAGAVEVDEVAMRGLELKYPGVRVADEMAKMHLWLLRHPAKRPANVWRFLDNWLKRVKPPTVAQEARSRRATVAAQIYGDWRERTIDGQRVQ